MTSPVCTPPLAMADRRADSSARYSRSASWRRRLFVRAAGDTLACQRISSASRFPTPAILDWSSSRALTATDPLVIRSRNSAGVTSAASGPSASMPGLSRTRPSRRLSNRTRLPPSAKLSVNRSHSALRGCASRRQRLAALGDLAVRGRDDDPAAHAQVDAEVWPVFRGLAPDRLAPPASRGEHPPGQRGAKLTGGVRPADERVAVVHVRDAPVQRLVGDQAAGGLDFGKFRHSFVLAGPNGRSNEDPALCGRPLGS